MNPSEYKLDPKAILACAEGIPGCQALPTCSPSQLSFLLTQPQIARVHIFADTGTIATMRILHGQVRTVFRRNVHRTDTVERALRTPATLTQIASSSCDALLSPAAQWEVLDLAITILQNEREQLGQHLQSLQPATNNNTENFAEARQFHCLLGMEFQFSLPEENMKHVDKCLSEIQAMGKLLRGMSTNGKGSVFLYGNGGVAYTPNIPKPLAHALKQLNAQERPSFISLGTKDRYFVALQNKACLCKGPPKLQLELDHAPQELLPPRSVSFGANYDTFFLVFADGSWTHNGRDIPRALKDQLMARQEREDLVCCMIGPQSEWFFKAQNGRTWWGGLSLAMDDAVQELLDTGHELQFMDFGVDGSYFLSYD